MIHVVKDVFVVFSRSLKCFLEKIFLVKVLNQIYQHVVLLIS